jgi:O-antigen/teichoic acid export membrane protein
MLKRNVIANMFGRLWPSFLGFFLVPVYLHYLGVEAYGLVGIFVSLQAIISFLDLGLSTTSNREIALRSRYTEKIAESRDLIRTLEIIYGVVAILIAGGFFAGAHWLATQWINARELSVDTVQLAAIIFGVSLALRWPVALYSGILQGSEKQVLLNGIISALATLRGAGAVFVVAFISPTLLAYLYWQLMVAVLEVVVMSQSAWRALPGDLAPRVNFGLMQNVWRFSFSVGANSLLAAFLKQLDRVLISKLLLLSQVGYYTTANVAYSAVSLFTSPLSAAAFPRFTTLIAEKDDAALSATYHKLSQIVSFVVAPMSGILFFFSYDILLIWTRSPDVAANASATLSILAVAAMFNSMMQIPFMLQLAAGITWIGLWNNAINLILLAPIMYFLINHYGIAGAGIGWAVFNLFYYAIVPHIMHRYILPEHKWAWIFNDTLAFIILAWVLVGGVYMIGYLIGNWLITFSSACLAMVLYLLVCVACYPYIKSLVPFSEIKRLKIIYLG